MPGVFRDDLRSPYRHGAGCVPPGLRFWRDRGPAIRSADAVPETRPQVSASAGTAGVESRQLCPRLPPLLCGAAEFLLQQGGRGGARSLPVDAPWGVAGRKVAYLRRIRAAPGRLGGPAEYPRLAAPAAQSGRWDGPVPARDGPATDFGD